MARRCTTFGRVSLSLGLCLASCGESGQAAPAADAGPTDTVQETSTGPQDAFANNWVQGYSARLTFHGGQADGRVIELERDLFDAADKGVFAFGSSHKTPPAISFAFQDDADALVNGNPAKLEFQIDFGNLIGSANDPVHVDKPGVYDFSCQPPRIRVFHAFTTYKSVCPDVDGQIAITDWSASQGGRFAGTFSGRLGAWYGSGTDECALAASACTKPEVYVDIEGHFGFELPPPDGK